MQDDHQNSPAERREEREKVITHWQGATDNMRQLFFAGTKIHPYIRDNPFNLQLLQLLLFRFTDKLEPFFS